MASQPGAMPAFHGEKEMTRAKCAALCLLVATLMGCERNAQRDAPQAAPGALLSSPKVSVSRAGSTQAEQPPAAASLPKPDPSVPAERYSDLNAEPAGASLTYVVSALSQTPMTDEEKLNRLSPVYYSEADSFKRRDIAKAELPRVNSELERYRRQNYYTLPITDFTKAPLALTNLSIGPYDANTRSFPLTGYGAQCWTGVLRNSQGAALKLQSSGVPCSVMVADEAAARAIEAARAARVLRLAGTLYLFVPAAEGGVALGIVSGARVEFVDSQSKAILGRFDIRS